MATASLQTYHEEKGEQCHFRTVSFSASLNSSQFGSAQIQLHVHRPYEVIKSLSLHILFGLRVCLCILR